MYLCRSEVLYKAVNFRSTWARHNPGLPEQEWRSCVVQFAKIMGQKTLFNELDTNYTKVTSPAYSFTVISLILLLICIIFGILQILKQSHLLLQIYQN
jgi:hypothetical protein